MTLGCNVNGLMGGLNAQFGSFIPLRLLHRRGSDLRDHDQFTSGDADTQAVLAAFVEELSDERVELKCVNDLALDTLLRLKLLMRCLRTSHEQFVPGRCFVPYRIAVKHKPQLSPGIELALVAHDGSVLRAPLHVSLPGMRTRTIVTLYRVDLSRPIVLLACSEPHNWFTALARRKGPQVVTVTLVDDLMSECGGSIARHVLTKSIARHVLTKSSDLLFFAGPCTGGSSWARLNKTRGIDTAEKIEAKQNEFWKLFGRFVEIKRHAMTKHAAILFELPGSCDYWKDERLREIVHDGTSHDFDGCRYGLKQRYAKKPLPIKKPWRVVSWNFELGDSLSKKCSETQSRQQCVSPLNQRFGTGPEPRWHSRCDVVFTHGSLSPSWISPHCASKSGFQSCLLKTLCSSKKTPEDHIHNQ